MPKNKHVYNTANAHRKVKLLKSDGKFPLGSSPDGRTHSLSQTDLEQCPTDTLISKLRSQGVPFSASAFLDTFKQRFSTDEIAGDWYENLPLNWDNWENEEDVEFFFSVATILTKRLAPEWISFEEVQEYMTARWEWDAQHKSEDWAQLVRDKLAVWYRLKPMIPESAREIGDLRPLLKLIPPPSDWFGDAFQEYELCSPDQAKTLGQEVITFVREFLATFPSTAPELLVKLKSLEASAYFAQEQWETGEQTCRSLIAQFPADATPYLLLAGKYEYPTPDSYPTTLENLVRAREVLQMALTNRVRNKKEVRDSLKDVKESIKFELL
jgi:hypothetical protein